MLCRIQKQRLSLFLDITNDPGDLDISHTLFRYSQITTRYTALQLYTIFPTYSSLSGIDSTLSIQNALFLPPLGRGLPHSHNQRPK